MIDIAAVILPNIVWIIAIIIGGTLISISVHFIPVGGAPAAMAQATGIGTGTVMLAAGAGIAGIIAAGAVMAVNQDLGVVIGAAAVGSMIMLAATMIVATWVYAYGVGVMPVSAKVKYDPITKYRQDLYVSQGTEGHGIPTVAYVSASIGALIGGLGGGLAYYALMKVGSYAYPGVTQLAVTNLNLVAVVATFTIGFFFINSVIPSYNIVGTIEGFHDPKFKRWPKAAIASFIASILLAIVAVVAVGALSGAFAAVGGI
jgi:tetrahydromethanopterin S-methyltransferase subunit D